MIKLFSLMIFLLKLKKEKTLDRLQTSFIFKNIKEKIMNNMNKI